jgi:hypothetical protein
MSFNLNSLTIDESVSKGGVWVDFLGGSRLKIASSNSHSYKAMVARLYKQHRLQLDDSNPDNFRLVQEITAKAMAQSVLLDWEGINWQDENGVLVENIPYSKAIGEKALLAADQLREFVAEQAGKPALFKKAITEEALGN